MAGNEDTGSQGPSSITRNQAAKKTNTTFGQSREQLLRTIESPVNGVDEGKKFLETAAYFITGQDYTPANLALVLLHLSQVKGLTKIVVNGLRAVALILEQAAKDNTATTIAEAVIARLSDPIDNLASGVLDVTSIAEELRASTVSLNGVIEEFREEYQTATQQITEVTDDVCLMAKAASKAITEATPTLTSATYASVVHAQLPPSHPSTIARTNTKTRQVLVDKAPDAVTNGLKDLTEIELVTKAKTALDLMPVFNDQPDETLFLGAKKLPNGGVLYDMNTAKAAIWLKTPDVMKAFLAGFGSTSIIRNRTYSVVIEYVPTSLNFEALDVLGAIERASNLPQMTVLEAKWIKPPARRTRAQRTAHIIMGLKTPEAANTAIRNGLYIEGKKVWARKLLTEPRRCLRCQRFDKGHLAADCRQEHETCGTCGAHHRTNDCEINEPRHWFCVNCNEHGHASWDRLCPCFIDHNKRFTNRNPENQYRYFPTDAPDTWEQLDATPTRDIRSDQIRNEVHRKGEARREGHEERRGRSPRSQRSPHPRERSPRNVRERSTQSTRGQGWLAGGPRGGGGGSTRAQVSSRGDRGKQRGDFYRPSNERRGDTYIPNYGHSQS